MSVQDAVYMPVGDSVYGPRRQAAFVVAVNCTEPGGTCFCASMGTGPGARDGFDLAITEVVGPGDHYFLVESGTDEGEEVLASLAGTRRAEADEAATGERLVTEAAGRMGRTLDTVDVKELLQGNLVNRRWDEVAARCLTCANCTMVCPTCFCSTMEDDLSIDGTVAERRRVWDSCFSLDFSFIHGGPLRASASARYRQWMTHKLASWQDQFGMIGCVGCGRCITWCPVGIDITAEAAAIRDSDVRTAYTVVGDPDLRRRAP
jgi:formate hydrogenlyase subunit 6/NADH:ubiquinone oxidoreductase subunit I